VTSSGAPNRALDFYTEALGLEQRADAPFGGGRWIEVAPSGADTVIALCPPGPNVTPGAKETGITLQTDNVDVPRPGGQQPDGRRGALSTPPRRVVRQHRACSGQLAGAPDEAGIDLGGALLAIECGHISPECGGGTEARLARPGPICIADLKARLAPADVPSGGTPRAS
jgi:hypothetical protein